MKSSDKELGVIAVLLKRLEEDRLPMMLALRKKVEAGERLGDGDIWYLQRALADTRAAGLGGLLEHHPEYNNLVIAVVSLYEQIVSHALENEQHQGE